MSEIKQLIEKLCPEGVEYRKLGKYAKSKDVLVSEGILDKILLKNLKGQYH